MRVLVTCEYSGRVRQAFRNLGHDAYSCDLLEAEDNSGYHIQDDAIFVSRSRHWGLMIAHPPCTHLAISGSRWFKDKEKEQEEALEFVRELMAAPIDHICIENPVSVISSRIRKPDQYIQPWMFGHEETKKTGLWLKNLPLLMPTKDVEPQMKNLPIAMRNRIHYMAPGPNRWKERSRTYQGIADAMAQQWGNING